jgi:2-alkenal reductase
MRLGNTLRFVVAAALVLLGGGIAYCVAQVAPKVEPRAVAPRGPLAEDERRLVAVFESAAPSVAYITTEVVRARGLFTTQVAQGAGSGFVWDTAGHVVTNNHVVEGAQRFFVQLDAGDPVEARPVGAAPEYDLAVIKLSRVPKDLRPIPVGTSKDLKIGQTVLAIGNPFGLRRTLTHGIVSALDRELPTTDYREVVGVIQIDAAINPGNSGGPLLDSQGNVIGINTAILGPGSNIGIGFAMPINKAKSMLDDYSAGRRYQRPRLGITVVYVAGDLAQAMELPSEGGLLIQEVTRGSAAEAAGLRGPRRWVTVGLNEIGIGGDLILAIDSAPVDRIDALSRALNRKRAGDTVELLIYRGGKTSKIKVTLGAAPE